MAKKESAGQLVVAMSGQVASYSNYGGRPPMSFRKGMLGVVRTHDELGVQVEFFSPETGLMEAARCDMDSLKKIAWPNGLVDLREKCSPASGLSLSNADWYFCGSMGPRSAINYLKAIALLNQAYYAELHVETLRIPGYHTSRQRSVEPTPSCFLRECAGGGSYHRATQIMVDLETLHRHQFEKLPEMAM